MKVNLVNNVEDSTFITRAKVVLSHNRKLGLGKLGDGLSPVTTNFFNFTVNFLGNYWCFWWTFYDTGSPPVRCCTCSVARGWGSISYFWHKFPPPISGPCHHQWPLWCSFNRMSLASEASCTLSAPLGWRWVNWTMTFLCMCVFGVRTKFGKIQSSGVLYAPKSLQLSGWSVKKCALMISMMYK